MQIDFHHTVIYVISRLAGYSHPDAELISYASQYVDDADQDGIIEFSNGAKFSRISSSHSAVNHHNIKDVNNQSVWVPFHFLPGNSGLKAGEDPDGGFIKKLVCRPDSPIAHEMLERCLADRGKPFSLHRLGITLHVLADTFAHQDFAGVINTINVKDNLIIDEEFTSLTDFEGNLPKINSAYKPESFFKDLFNKIKSRFLGSIVPLGHGPVLTYPDLPFLKWKYTNKPDIEFKRDNTKIFLGAVLRLYDFIKEFRGEDPNLQKFPKEYLEEIRKNFTDFKEYSGHKRHLRWLDSIKEGQFGFKEVLVYETEGEGSWKQLSLKEKDPEYIDKYIYENAFLSSNWKLFHDALQKHKFELAHEILPKYGICVA